jgi:hypothetical protein
MANLGADQLAGLSKNSKSSKSKKGRGNALQPLDQVESKSYLGRVLDEVQEDS